VAFYSQKGALFLDISEQEEQTSARDSLFRISLPIFLTSRSDIAFAEPVHRMHVCVCVCVCIVTGNSMF